MPSPGQFPEENPTADIVQRLRMLETAARRFGSDGTFNLAYIAERAATAVPSTYPSGFSVMSVTSDASWPLGTTDGLVETWITGAGAAGYRIRQTYTGQGGYLVFHRYGATNDTWASWQLVTPYLASTTTATQYEIVTASTWETVRTLTMTALPTQRFDGGVNARAVATARNPAGTSAITQLRIQTSLDGGSTWATSMTQVATHTGTWQFVSYSVEMGLEGAVTGSIQVRLQANSDRADTFIDNIFVGAQIVGVH